MLLSYIAEEKDNDRTAGSIVRHEMDVSAALLRRMKTVGAIRVSGLPVFTNHKVTSGEIIEADVSAAELHCDNIPERGSLELLYENDGLIAVNKPVGMLIHPSRTRNTGTLANYVAGYLLERSGSGACHAVNRLDRDTSGVVLFAKNGYMKARTVTALTDAVKEYIALLEGEMDGRGTIDAPIRRYEQGNMLRVVSPTGQRAVTHYETIRVIDTEYGQVSLVRLLLETGRTHQIRVHSLYYGHPMLGDILYNTDTSRLLSGQLGIRTQAMHADRLEFTDPISGKTIEIRAKRPEVFYRISDERYRK